MEVQFDLPSNHDFNMEAPLFEGEDDVYQNMFDCTNELAMDWGKEDSELKSLFDEIEACEQPKTTICTCEEQSRNGHVVATHITSSHSMTSKDLEVSDSDSEAEVFGKRVWDINDDDGVYGSCCHNDNSLERKVARLIAARDALVSPAPSERCDYLVTDCHEVSESSSNHDDAVLSGDLSETDSFEESDGDNFDSFKNQHFSDPMETARTPEAIASHSQDELNEMHLAKSQDVSFEEHDISVNLARHPGAKLARHPGSRSSASIQVSCTTDDDVSVLTSDFSAAEDSPIKKRRLTYHHDDESDLKPAAVESSSPVKPLSIQVSEQTSQEQTQTVAPTVVSPRGKSKPDKVDAWTKNFNELSAFRSELGHCIVPFSFKGNPALGTWVKRQRYQYKLMKDGKPHHMSDARIAALEALDFCWDPQSAVWYERFGELKKFKEVSGTCHVPITYAPNPKLAIWVKCQRRQYKIFTDGNPCSITQDRIAKLEALGFEWVLRSRKRDRSD